MKFYEKAHRSLEDVERFIGNNDNFIIYGTKSFSAKIVRWLENEHKKVFGIFENAVTLLNTLAKDRRKIIIFDNFYIIKNIELFRKYGLKPFEDYVLVESPVHFQAEWIDSLGSSFYKDVQNNRDKIEAVCNSLSDNYSKNIYGKVIDLRLKLLDTVDFQVNDIPFIDSELDCDLPQVIIDAIDNIKLFDYYKYFDRVTPYGKNTIVDAGAFNGYTAAQFSLASQQAEIYCFEPLDSGYQQLSEVARHLKKLHPIKKALSDKTGEFPFQQVKFEPTASFLGPGDGVIKTVTLDDFVAENDLNSVDLIKIDVEGAEANVLKGAVKTIARYHPQMVISIYHRNSHLWNIPLWIAKNFPNYSIYMDHKRLRFTETLLFCA